MSNFDWTIIAAYLLAVVGLGVAAGFLRRKGERGGEGGHYFLAGNTLTWPVIGLAMFAANISTVHLVSLAEAAYKYGLVFGNFEWMAGFTLILLSLFFAPLYLRSKVLHCRIFSNAASIAAAAMCCPSCRCFPRLSFTWAWRFTRRRGCCVAFLASRRAQRSGAWMR
ncbi:MAG: hypothetical protein WDM76_05215 [Limisphaerales bacterium]